MEEAVDCKTKYKGNTILQTKSLFAAKRKIRGSNALHSRSIQIEKDKVAALKSVLFTVQQEWRQVLPVCLLDGNKVLSKSTLMLKIICP